MLFSASFSEITEKDINNLITNKIPEQKSLEYKRQLPDKDKEEQKIKILQSITSFANTEGGIIIFGMKENDEGEASEIAGIETSTDDDFLRLQNLVRDRIEPRMAPPELRELMINDTKIYLMKIHSSYNKPHFVKNNFVFYGRHSNGKYQLNIEEIKLLFLFAKTTEEQFEQFRIQRIMKLKSGNFPFKYNSDKIVCLHIAPLSSLSNKYQIEMSRLADEKITFTPIENPEIKTKVYRSFNYDGLLFNTYSEKRKVMEYIQLFRNGIIEIANFSMFKESSLLFNPETHSVINGCQLEDYIINSIYRNIDILSKFETPYPFFISISLLNVKNCRIDNGVIYATGFNGNLIPENDLILPSIYIENNIDIPGKLACCFEVLWNASGYAKSLNNTQEPSHA